MNKKKRSVFNRVFLPLLAIIVLQVVILYGSLTGYGIFRKLNANSFGLLRERTQNRYQTLSAKMIGEWSDLTSESEQIERIIEDALKEENKDWSAVGTDAALNEVIENRALETLIWGLRNHKTTGIFMVLNKADAAGTGTYAGLYLRDSDPDTNAGDYSDISVLRGLPSVARQNGYSLNSFWESAFTFENGDKNPNNDFFCKPMAAAQGSSQTKARYFGYWAQPFFVGGKKDMSVITYSVPLINSDGAVYGVMGVEISQSYLESMIRTESYAGKENCFYYIGLTKDGGKTYEKINSSGNKYNIGDFTAESTDLISENQFLKTSTTAGNVLYGYADPLKLYGSNTPFQEEQWVLLGMQEETSLLSGTVQIRETVLLSMIVTVMLGLVLAVFSSRAIVRPIVELVNGVRKKQLQEEISLPHSGVQEIDELADAVEIMSREIMEAASHTSRLIELSGLPVGVYELRNGAEQAYCSDGFLHILNFTGSVESQIHNQISREKLEEILKQLKEKPEEDGIYEIEEENGSKRYVQLVTQKDDIAQIGAVVDVTDSVLNRRRIERERDFDSLTGIWNRRTFMKRMTRLFTEEKEKLGIGVLLMMDLDDLKFLNDSYGHDCGDDYIGNFARALCNHKKDHMIMARRSGDEFYLFMYGFQTKQEARGEMERFWEELGQHSIALPDNTHYKIRVSGGAAWYPQDSELPDQLIHYADFAMYQVKHSHKGTLQEFDPEIYHSDSFLVNGKDALNRLIDYEQVYFVLQPIISRAGEIYGYEFLMRGEVPELTSPEVILKMAKAQGKLHYIEVITWRKALQTAGELTQQGVIQKDCKLFINSIASQVMFENEKHQIKEQYPELLHRVVVELTEGEENNQDFLQEKLSMARATGGIVAIDDFGNGYSNELSLLMIPADIVKIDMGLVRGVDQDKDKQMLIRNLISYARKRNIAILAEGVETREEMKVLLGLGVDYLQGYYLARPERVPERVNEDLKREILAFAKNDAQVSDG